MIPISFYVPIVAMLIGLFVGGAGTKIVMSAQLSSLKAEHARERALQADQAKTAEHKARADERRTALRIMETADAANLQAADARRSAAAAAGERDRLRDAYVELASRTGGAAAPTSAAPGGSPASGSGLVLTRLFDGADALLRSCAAALDQSRIAGLACERSYDSLTLISTKD